MESNGQSVERNVVRDENDHQTEDRKAQGPDRDGANGGDDDDDDSQTKNDGNSSVASEDTVEPDYEMANSLPFAKLCQRMEKLWALKFRKLKKPTLDEKKRFLLPPEILKKLESHSVFPLFRLLMPKEDNSRRFEMKESLIAKAYCDAKGFAKGTSNYKMLHGYTDPTKVPDKTAGDMSLVVQHMLQQRIPNKPSKLTVGQINALLDELSSIAQRRRGSYSHEWRSSSSSQQQSARQPARKPKKKENSAAAQREQWFRKIMQKGLSPLEHKWLVRILLEKVEFGLGYKAILEWYNPFAMELWHAHNSLKNLCDKLANPQYYDYRVAEEQRKRAMQEAKEGGGLNLWEPQEQPLALGNTISPMLSTRTYFDSCMTKLQENHATYLKHLDPNTPASVRECLALRFPAICAEIKFDGERIVAHIQNGQVTMQTRNGKWYSNLYSPVLGGPIRKALANYKVNVILDGEVEAWDNGRQEIIPFGNNRTVANARRDYLRRHGNLEAIDQDLHVGPDGTISDPNVMRVSDDYRILKSVERRDREDDDERGKESWLQYLVFDILYVDGPDAKKLFRDCLMEDDAIVPGSLLHFSLLQRKIILHQLLDEQANQVEIGKTIVVRPNGESMRGKTYFSMKEPAMDKGDIPAALLDSTQTAIQKCMPPNILELDRLRRHGRNDEEINRLRAKAVEGFYMEVVEQHKMEGLVLKDLASPYILGPASKRRKYWHKLKPDYEHGETIDVVILGAFFATGLRHSGRLSHFLCGVVDESDPQAFMPALNVNGKSTAYEKLDKMMELTGYHVATADEPLRMGKWFEEEDHGRMLPDFISHRSYQRRVDGRLQEDFDGWTFSKKTYPDLWIRPEDSFVLELKGQEFVESTEYAAGVTMRFPRIKRVRHEEIDGDPKAPHQADTHHSLFLSYLDTMRQRQYQAASVQDSTFSPSATSSNTQMPLFQSRFLTPEEYARRFKKRRKKSSVLSPEKVPKVAHVKSNALAGVSFTILEGNYSLDVESLVAQDAKDNDWLDEALKVKRKEDVMEFVLSHSGAIRVSADCNETFVIGGQANDARVIKYIDAIANARTSLPGIKIPKTKKARELQKIASKEGVLRWTFVFSIVHRWLADQKRQTNLDGVSTPNIKETSDWLLRPTAHDYLLKSSSQDGSTDHIFDLQHPEEIPKIEILRILEDQNAKDGIDIPVYPWQYESIRAFEDEVQWAIQPRSGPVLDGESMQNKNLVLYPDIFGDEFGLMNGDEALATFLSGEDAKRWNCGSDVMSDMISPVLPLASALGFVVSPHLHSGVTHILSSTIRTNLVEQREFDREKDDIVAERLHILGISSRIKFVSPHWVQSLWQKCFLSEKS